VAGPQVAHHLGDVVVVEQRLADAGVEHARQTLARQQRAPRRLDFTQQLAHRQTASERQQRRRTEATPDRAANLGRDTDVDLHAARHLGVSPNLVAEADHPRGPPQQVEAPAVNADDHALDGRAVLEAQHELPRGAEPDRLLERVEGSAADMLLDHGQGRAGDHWRFAEAIHGRKRRGHRRPRARAHRGFLLCPASLHHRRILSRYAGVSQ
jgi:hypothetical protein